MFAFQPERPQQQPSPRSLSDATRRSVRPTTRLFVTAENGPQSDLSEQPTGPVPQADGEP